MLRRRRVAALTVAVLVVLVVVAVASGTAPSERRRPPATANTGGGSAHRARVTSPARPPALRVATMTVTIVEPSPPAIATAHLATGAPARLIPTTIRYPVAVRGSGPKLLPLVVFSPGFDIAPSAYAGLLDGWVRRGFVVAEPAFPLTAPSSAGVNEADIVNHPRDLRFVITSLLGDAQNPRSPLDGRIDPAAVAVAGHSDGGDVSLAVAENTCCSDSRIRSAVILSGAQLSAFGGGYDAHPRLPLLVVQGSADTVNLPACSVALYNDAPPPKDYLALPGAAHEPPYLDPGPDRQIVSRVVVAFLRATLQGRTAALSALRRPAALGPGAQLSAPPRLPLPAEDLCPGAP